MKAKLLILALVLASYVRGADPAPTRFESLKTSEGKEYRQVSVSRVLPLSIVVTHSEGEAMIPFRMLPPEVQSAFGYDPAQRALDLERQEALAGKAQAKRLRDAASRERKAQEKANETALKTAKEAERIYFLAEVVDVLEKGVVLKEVEFAKAGEKPFAMDPEALIYFECEFMGELGRPYYKRGDVRRLSGWPNGQHTYTTKKGAQAFIPAYVWHWSPEHRAIMSEANRQARGR
jgi:hypothetical protein